MPSERRKGEVNSGEIGRADGIDLSTRVTAHSHCITHTASIPQGHEGSRLYKLIWLTLSSLQDNPA